MELALAKYSQCLVRAVLGLEEAQHKEGYRLQTQHQHDAPDEAGPVKARVGAFGSWGFPYGARAQ